MTNLVHMLMIAQRLGWQAGTVCTTLPEVQACMRCAYMCSYGASRMPAHASLAMLHWRISSPSNTPFGGLAGQVPGEQHKAHGGLLAVAERGWLRLVL